MNNDTSNFQKFEREPAKRVFAAELREATKFIKGSEDSKSPGYIILPTGERCNRVMIAGTLTDKTKSGDENVLYRARVSDPTGTFFISASSFQSEAMMQMSKIEGDIPAFVIVIGKPNVYTSNDGRILVSIRAESIQVVTRDERDMWVVDTSRSTMARVENMFDESVENPDIMTAKESYQQTAEHWRKVIYDALASLM